MSLNLIPQSQRIELLLGQALDLTIPVNDRSGDPVDVEGADIEFTLGSSGTAEPTDSLPTTATGSQISVSLSSAKSLELGASNLFFACWVTILGESTPIARGSLIIRGSTRG